MKKFLCLLISILLILSAVFALSSCGKKKDKLPETAYEKVAFAFNGVEKSFKDADKRSADATTYAVKRLLAGEGDPLSTIRGVYTSGDSQGDVIDDLEYTQPPMIQFQCLKAVLEKIGKGFEFGAKYYDDITGEVFVDTATGRDMSDDANKNDYKYDYTFRLALQIDIDEADLIKADVSFDIRLVRGNEDVSMIWYVKMILDYDMTNTTPIYTLTMWTANDERELAFRGNYTYEYDYVDMKAAGINEWRKFVLEPDAKLVKDANHQSFETYRGEGVVFNADTCKWYADKDLKKITRYDENKGAIIADAFYAFGLHSTNIDGTAFLSVDGIQSNAIKTAYNDFSEIFKKDVIYSLVTEKEDDHSGGNGGNGNAVAVGISVLTEEGEAWSARNIERDCTLSELLSGYGPWGQGIGAKRPCVYSIDADGNRIERLENFTDYDFTITVGKPGQGGYESKIGLGDRLSDVIADKLGGMEAIEQNGFLVNVGLTSKTDPRKTATFSAIIGFRSEIEEQEAKHFPAELTAFGVPEYATQNGSFELGDYKEGNAQVTLRITGSNNDERAAYLAKLNTLGFVQDNEYAYVKIVGQNVVKIRVPDFDYETLTITAIRQANGSPTYSETFPTEAVAGWVDGKFTVTAPNLGGTYLYCYDADAKYIYIYGMNAVETPYMLLTIGSQTDTKINDENRTITAYRDGRFYTIEYVLENNNALFLMLDLTRIPPQEPQITISVNGGEAQPFWPDRGWYSITVKLAARDTFKIAFGEGKGRINDDPESCFTYDEMTDTYTVNANGTYVISGLMGDLRVEKN
ncbi:MAG: hypothetical protein J6Z13_01915 [Clostridia bacterium]|nr:hypothetical protein [Clostridia bacterium]